jgi:DNA-binding CsgD family transcriptional regulator
MVAGMRDELLADARNFHRFWRRWQDKTAANAQEVLSEPQKWAPILAHNLCDRTEHLRSKALKRYGIDLFKDHDEAQPRMRTLSSARESLRLVLLITEFALLSETAKCAAIDSLDLLDDPPERDRRLCEWVVTSWHAVPMMHAALWWTLAESESSAVAQMSKEMLTAHLAGFLATKTSLTVNKRLRALLEAVDGAYFNSLLEQLLTEAFGVWADHDPRHQNADDLVREAARRTEKYLTGQAVTNKVEVAPGDFEDPAEGLDQFEEFIARETARTEIARYRAARHRAKLAPRQRQALDLREAGFSEKEIAAEMRVTPGAVKSHLSRARAKILAEMYREE